ncbi:MAG TPA: hypothetical protein PLQ94_07760, partial [Anaerolineales bacterium]|nr:hypothetical protein [Anaerolineales bacterium]
MAKTELDLEFEKLQVEKEKLRLEQAKLRLDEERYKDDKKFRLWTILSIVVPLITIAVSVSFSMWSQYKQAQTEIVLRSMEAVINAKSPSETQNKLKTIQYLFPNQLPDDFSTAFASFEPDNFSGKFSYDNAMNFLNLMANAGASKDEVLDMYKKIFPESTYIKA